MTQANILRFIQGIGTGYLIGLVVVLSLLNGLTRSQSCRRRSVISARARIATGVRRPVFKTAPHDYVA